MARPRKPKPPEPTDEEIRNQALRFLYDAHKSARSSEAASPTMGAIKKAMKSLSVKEHRIVSNVLYLVQNRWTEERIEPITVYQRGRPFATKRTTYRITAAGIDRFEGPSTFQRVDRMAGINITNIQGVTVVGQDNIVRVRFESLFRDLDALGAAIRSVDALPDQEKLAYQADVETIKTQLAKEEPDRGILQRAWEGLKNVAALPGVATILGKVRAAIEPLLR